MTHCYTNSSPTLLGVKRVGSIALFTKGKRNGLNLIHTFEAAYFLKAEQVRVVDIVLKDIGQLGKRLAANIPLKDR